MVSITFRGELLPRPGGRPACPSIRSPVRRPNRRTRLCGTNTSSADAWKPCAGARRKPLPLERISITPRTAVPPAARGYSAPLRERAVAPILPVMHEADTKRGCLDPSGGGSRSQRQYTCRVGIHSMGMLKISGPSRNTRGRYRRFSKRVSPAAIPRKAKFFGNVPVGHVLPPFDPAETNALNARMDAEKLGIQIERGIGHFIDQDLLEFAPD